MNGHPPQQKTSLIAQERMPDIPDGGKQTRSQKQELSQSGLGQKKPSWLKVRLPGGGEFSRVSGIVKDHGLHTVCQEARCPNIGECWGRGTATFQIMGDTCTRACRYCNIKTGLPEEAPDVLEPGKVANAAKVMGVRHCVVTSVDRDDLEDRGAGHFAQTITAIRRRSPETTIEVLTPDFMDREEAALQTVIGARPDVFNHNTETVPRLFRRIRPKGSYERTMSLLRRAKEVARELGQPPLMTKSGLIVGMGETEEEIFDVLRDLRANGVDVVTIGQYLRPTAKHIPVDRFVTPDEFKRFEEFGIELGFGSIFAGPLVRSSYKAEEQVFAAKDPTMSVPEVGERISGKTIREAAAVNHA